MLDSNDDDSDSNRSDYLSNVGEDVDVHLNHYRIPKLSSFGSNGTNNSPKLRVNREQVKCNNDGKILSLIELAAQKVACHLPFGEVERFSPPVPEPMQCRIAFWSFPQDEEDVRLYTCLANGNADVFMRAEELLARNAVCDLLQVGFHLSANVQFMNESDEMEHFRVAVTFDRRKILTCNCSCLSMSCYCQHAVAVCLQRIRKPNEVTIRAPISESLQRLDKNQLQKLAQYLINESPQQFLPPAQCLIDELLSGDNAIINQNSAAPDPTAGAAIHEETSWYLDYVHLSADIQKILQKQCTTQPTVCDVQSLHITAPPASAEYSQLLRPIRGREPEGLWNLISIVGEMMRRRDSNFTQLLEIITEEVMKLDKIVTWWFETKVSLHSGSTIHFANSKSSQSTSQYSCSNFSDEIVHLWRLAAMNPDASPEERKQLYDKFFQWHLFILQRHRSVTENGSACLAKANKRNILELFPGFKSAMEGSLIDWSDWDPKRAKLIIHDEVTNERSKRNKKKKRKSKKQTTSDCTSIASSECQPSTSTSAQATEQYSQQALEIGKGSSNQDEASISIKEDDEDERENSRLNEVNEEADEDSQEFDLPEQVQQLQIAEVDENRAVEVAGPEEDLQIYYMDRLVEDPSGPQKPESIEDLIKVNLKKLGDPLETMYAKAEGLYAHGHIEEARYLAFRVANDILNHRNYPSPRQLYNLPRRRKKKGTLDNQMSIVTSETLTKVTFLCNVLAEDPSNHSLIFKLILFGIRMKRSPAATKPLEVKLINQKQELISILKNIIIREVELDVLREIAQSLSDSACENRLDPLTTLMVGNYLFEALVLSRPPTCTNCTVRDPNDPRSQSSSVAVATSSSSSSSSAAAATSQGSHPNNHSNHQDQNEPRNHAPNLDFNPVLHNLHPHETSRPSTLHIHGKRPSDTELGFQAALDALSVKINILETDHPLLCEGIRRQRGELALSLLIHYKDDQDKLDLILSHLLDKNVILSPAQKMATPTQASSLSSNPGPATSSAATNVVPTAASSTPPFANGTDESKTTNGGISRVSTSKKVPPSQDPSQPTEASAHFMFELSKTVFDKAGGNSLTAHLFRPQLMAQNDGRDIHRNLHMCTLRIALYALGLHNRTSSTWMNRTYSGRASFIHEQALEIGLPAIKFLKDNWEGYLTPVEAASIADKAGCSNDIETKQIAAEMAKSCLKSAHYLDLNAVTRILAQCKEQTMEMIESACNEIEQVAETENVCADVLFVTARTWGELSQTVVNRTMHHFDGSKVFQLNMSPQPNVIIEQDNGVANWSGVQLNAPTEHWNCHQLNDMTPPPAMMVMTRDVNYLPNQNPESPIYTNIDYLRAAYRVGIKALDSLRSSMHVGSKHNPKKIDDILWLFGLSKSLGRDCVHKFSQSAITNIIDPYILETIIFNINKLFGGEDHIDKINILLPVIDKCLERCARQTKELMKQTTYTQRTEIDSILDIAQRVTGLATHPTALNIFEDLLNTVDRMYETRKVKKYRFKIDVKHRQQWVKYLKEYCHNEYCTNDECAKVRHWLDIETRKLYPIP